MWGGGEGEKCWERGALILVYITLVDDIQGLDWDWSSGRLYFSSASQGTVFALPLDTSEPTPQVLVSGRVSPRGVTLNVVTR